VDPYRSEVYVADAIDYVQSGRVYRYTPQGTLLDDFAAGVIPGAFCFK
ncbi:MAG: YncE family protein, partial [Alistipes sp.]|nr:YncE family protein [Alistipes sp.]